MEDLIQHGGIYTEIILKYMELTPVYIIFGNIHTDDGSMIVMRGDGYPSYVFAGNHPGELTPYVIDHWDLKWAYLSGIYTCIDLPISVYCYSSNNSYDYSR